jgi:YegS/Rv2252/BmrU family lipid kinase
MEQEIVDACAKRQLSYHIYYTTQRRNAITYVRSMVKEYPDERQRFICVGGDGTINEIANSAPANPNIEFGVIPNGSGNDFVRNFKHRRLFTDIDAQIDGTAHSFDLIKCNDDYCVNMVNIGFDCSVVIEADKFRKYKFISPSISYILGVVVGFFFKKFGTKMKVIFDDGEIVDKELTLTAIGNGKFCGGGFKSAPLADLKDGLLDVCIIDKVSRLNFIQLVGSYKEGTFLENKKARKIIKYKQTNHFRMEFEEPQPICIDGEISNAKSVEFTVIPGAFNFVIPKGSALRFPKK